MKTHLKDISWFIFVFCLIAHTSQTAIKDEVNPLQNAEVTHSEYSINESPIFVCRFRMSSKPEVTWLKDNSALPENQRFIITEKTQDYQTQDPLDQIESLYFSHLQIIGLQYEDSGTYECIVSDSSKEPRRSFKLKVKEPDVLIQQGILSTPQILSCSFTQQDDRELPEAVWKKEGSPLPINDSRYKFGKRIVDKPKSLVLEEAGIHLRKVVFMLIITSVKLDDAGKYSCSIRNHLTSQNIDIFFNLLVKEQTPQNISVTQGEDPSFVCGIMANRPALITWKKNGNVLPKIQKYKISSGTGNSSSISIFEHLGNHGIHYNMTISKLVIVGAQPEDSGNYTCVDENTLNNQGEKWFTLNVNKTKKSVYEKTVGENALLDCAFGSLKFTPRVTWLKNGQRLKEDSRTNSRLKEDKNRFSNLNDKTQWLQFLAEVKYTSLLTINKVHKSDSAKYTCLIDNDPSNKSHQQEFNLTVKD